MTSSVWSTSVQKSRALPGVIRVQPERNLIAPQDSSSQPSTSIRLKTKAIVLLVLMSAALPGLKSARSTEVVISSQRYVFHCSLKRILLQKAKFGEPTILHSSSLNGIWRAEDPCGQSPIESAEPVDRKSKRGATTGHQHRCHSRLLRSEWPLHNAGKGISEPFFAHFVRQGGLALRKKVCS